MELLKGQKCAMPAVASCAKEWEAQHQFRALQEHGLDEEFPYGIYAIQHVAEALIAARAEVEHYRDKAAKYDALRERFPFWPGDEFYVADKGVILRRSVYGIYVNGQISTAETAYHVSQCHPTADACRAAIPVEE